jgi:hypothetical protein
MKVALFLLATIAYSQAAHFYWYSGSTSTNATIGGTPSPTATYVASFTGGVCTPGAAASGYQKFTINATVNSFWYITGLFDRDIDGTAQIQVYKGTFSATAPCGNLTALIESSSGGAPHASDLLWLTPGLYDVVVTTSSGEGLFAVHADSSKNQKQLTATDPWRQIPSYSSSSCVNSGSDAPYYYYVFSPATTGLYDVFFYGYNSTTTFTNYIVGTLYNGTVSNLGAGNSSNPADLCTGSAFVDVDDDDSSLSGVSTSRQAAGVFPKQMLTAGVNYTIVVSSYYDATYGAFGVWWRPTVYGNVGDQATYTPPQFSGGVIDQPCTASTTAKYWDSVIFKATQSTYVIDNGSVGGSFSGFDTDACVYSGNNAGTKYTVGPVSCTNVIQCGDTGDVAPLGITGLIPNSNYTVVTTSHFTTTALRDYVLFIYSGVQLGPAPVVTTSSSSGMASSDAFTVAASAALIAIAALF